MDTVNEPPKVKDDSRQDPDAAKEPGLGRRARFPGNIPPRGWWHIIKRVAVAFLEDRVMLVSAGVALYLLIALVPSLSAIVSIYGLFSKPDSISEQLSLFVGIVPEGGLELMRTQLARIASENEGSLGRALIIGLAVATWSASLGVKGMFEAMNIAYGEREKRNILHFNGLALLFTFGTSLVAVAALAAIVILPAILSILPVDFKLEWLARILSFLLLAAVLIVGLAVLYRWGPSREDARWRWVTPGAIFAIVSVLVISSIFSWYVASFGNFSATYGSLGAIIGFLFWLWFSVIAVVLGGELNAEIERQTAVDTTTPPEMPMGERGAYVADTLGE